VVETGGEGVGAGEREREPFGREIYGKSACKSTAISISHLMGSYNGDFRHLELLLDWSTGAGQ